MKNIYILNLDRQTFVKAELSAEDLASIYCSTFDERTKVYLQDWAKTCQHLDWYKLNETFFLVCLDIGEILKSKAGLTF